MHHLLCDQASTLRRGQRKRKLSRKIQSPSTESQSSIKLPSPVKKRKTTPKKNTRIQLKNYLHERVQVEFEDSTHVGTFMRVWKDNVYIKFDSDASRQTTVSVLPKKAVTQYIRDGKINIISE